MNDMEKTITILMADDDEDDRLMAQEALQEARLANDLHFVLDGEELMDYLYHRGKYADGSNAPRPGLILLDLNMPKKDGREALKEIKSDPALRQIPIVVLTTSKAVTLKDIASRIGKIKLDKVTIYMALDKFVEIGLVLADRL